MALVSFDKELAFPERRREGRRGERPQSGRPDERRAAPPKPGQPLAAVLTSIPAKLASTHLRPFAQRLGFYDQSRLRAGKDEFIPSPPPARLPASCDPCQALRPPQSGPGALDPRDAGERCLLSSEPAHLGPLEVVNGGEANPKQDKQGKLRQTEGR